MCVTVLTYATYAKFGLQQHTLLNYPRVPQYVDVNKRRPTDIRPLEKVRDANSTANAKDLVRFACFFVYFWYLYMLNFICTDLCVL